MANAAKGSGLHVSTHVNDVIANCPAHDTLPPNLNLNILIILALFPVKALFANRNASPVKVKDMDFCDISGGFPALLDCASSSSGKFGLSVG